ncbi:polysaccharide synthesis protein GtrA [Enemella dayhoffiae]|uniref:Polysaccharide synthesis protein GtrA n=1 Tax=Enemella dayhoffiae TaxID=2016507 RepID=A0A255GNC6_9ACTN|nr:GtrA family protein [Enemella dayhoffiae]OYO17315.1 polysaccharide synthesis protein GtrA [Enemella dayhoffiae]
MKRAAHYVFVRQRHNWLQFLRFGLVGGSGVLVNLIVTVICKKLLPPYLSIAFPLPVTDFNVRWYHVITTIAFLVANTWNFQLNRSWTFKSGKHASWWREFFPFLAVGMVAYVVGQVLLTLLLKDTSPVSLHQFPFFDDSTGLRTALYWATLIQIVLTMPINYVVNKVWTFRAVRGRKKHPEHDLPMVAAAVAPELVDEDGNELQDRRRPETPPGG